MVTRGRIVNSIATTIIFTYPMLSIANANEPYFFLYEMPPDIYAIF